MNYVNLDDKVKSVCGDLKSAGIKGDKETVGNTAGALIDGMVDALDTLIHSGGSGFTFGQETTAYDGRFDTLLNRVDDLRAAVLRAQ